MNVWLITGGMSSEREVALASGAAVAEALLAGGHRVYAYDLSTGRCMPELSSPDLVAVDAASRGRSLPAAAARGGTARGASGPEWNWAEGLIATGRSMREYVEVAFLALHGDEGENGAVQTLLESIDFPYTGSGPAASAIAMDKVLSKHLMVGLGVPTPPWLLLPSPAGGPGAPETDYPPVSILDGSPVGGLPVVVKPIAEGSSVGVTVVTRPEEWVRALREAAFPGGLTPKSGRSAVAWSQVIVEKYVPGMELTVGVLDGEVLPVVEILPKTGFYDYRRKYTTGETIYKVPAPISPVETRTTQASALSIYFATNCRGMARVDFRMAPGEPAQCLEVNTIPGLTSTSLVPKAAQAIGIEFLELLERVCRAALARRAR
jgi:D-alanine-D-alanine ligase